jgi:hypothetical protein
MSNQSSDKANAKVSVKSVKQGFPTSVPGNIMPSGNKTSGSSQMSKRGKQGE